MPLILVIDGHSVYRQGLRLVIEARVDQSRVVEATILEHAATKGRFDLMLIDAASLSHSSPDVLRKVRALNPDTRFAVMSNSQTRADVFGCLSAGFHGFVCKLQSEAELLIAISDLLSGRIYVPRWLVDEAPCPGVEVSQDSDVAKLTQRQREVLPLLAAGMSTKEIARHLRIAPGTAKIHTAALLRALHARNRTEAAFIAAKLMRSRVARESRSNTLLQATSFEGSTLAADPARLQSAGDAVQIARRESSTATKARP